MKHTFDCGITAESHDCAGDLLLAQIITGRCIYDFPGIPKLGPDIRFEIHDFDPCWLDSDFREKMRQVTNAMIRRGYTCWRSQCPAEMTTRFRFFWPKP